MCTKPYIQLQSAGAGKAGIVPYSMTGNKEKMPSAEMLGFGGLSPLLEQHQLLNKLRLSTFTHSCTTPGEELAVSVGGLWRGAVSGCVQLGRRRKLQLLVFAHTAHIPT